MSTNQHISSLDNIFQWITRIAILNFCWLLFTLLGLGMFGLFPATAASLSVSRRWILGEHDLKVLGVFKKVYQKEFLLANGLGWTLLLVGGLLYFNYTLIANSINEFPMIITFAFYLIIFFYSLLMIWTFPLLAHYETNLIKYLKNALIIGISNLHITITISILLFSIIYYSLEFPSLIIFISFSIFSMIWMWLSMRVFLQIDYKNRESNEHFEI